MGNEEQKRSKISVINEEILSDKNLTPSEKMVYARICYFELFFESPKETAEYLGLSEWAVKSAKRKLEQLGYIICVQDTGRGKQYIADVNVGVGNTNSRCLEKQHQVLEKPISDVGNNNIRCLENQYIGKNIIKNIGKKENKKESGRETFASILEEKVADEELRVLFQEFIKMRKMIRAPLTNYALKLAINKTEKLSGGDIEKAKRIVEQSIERSWKGLFDVPDEVKQKSNDNLYKPKDGEDISYRRMFGVWKKFLGYSVKETNDNVQACRDLLADIGEESLTRLIVALKMRGEHKFLTKELKSVSDFVGLKQNVGVVQSFYDEHWKFWKMRQEAESKGKKVWEL